MLWVIIGLMAYGLMQEMRYSTAMLAEYRIMPVTSPFIGIGSFIALLGFAFDIPGTFTGFGLAIAIVLQLKALKTAKLDAIKAKQCGMSAMECFKLGPFAVFFRLMLFGLGSVLHIIFTITIIGIPLYRGLKNSLANLDGYCEQVNLRNRLYAMQEMTEEQEMKGRR